VLAEVHRSADPQPRGDGAVAAGRRGDPAQLRVDLGTVVALVVVLDHDLPVGLDLVLVRGRRHQPVRPVGLQQLGQVAHMVLQRRRVGGDVHEHPAHPLGHPGRGQAFAYRVVVGQAGEPRRASERAVQPIHPRVIGAPDGPEVRELPRSEELVATMPAHVEERMGSALLVPGEQDSLRAHVDRPLVARAGQQVRTPHANPGRLEEAPVLPGEHLLRRVRISWKRPAPAERGQRRVQEPGIDR
jgi:hypothetical protein